MVGGPEGRCDPVTRAVIGGALLAAAEAVGTALVRSAFSPNIKERRDCSAAVFDAAGQLLAQAEHIPIHLGSLLGVVSAVLARYPQEEIVPADCFIANDPYGGGGTHLPDVTLVSPIFHAGELVAFVANIAHHADIGGAVPGGIAGDAASIYAEGLRLPPVRLARGGALQQEILDLIRLNCRQPEERQVDLEGQTAANRVGAARLAELWQRYGPEVMQAACADLLDHGEARLRAALAAVPDGVYRCTDYLDDDGAGRTDIPVQVALAVDGTALHLDFSGTGPQSAGAINVVRPALLATVAYAVKAGLDPDLPPNAGFHRPITVRAPAGSLLNPHPPAAVGARTDTCQRVAGVVLGALAQARPGQLPAGSNDASSAVVFSGRHPGRGRTYVYVEAVGGGGGARPGKDGWDGVQVHVTNTSNLPVESLEHAFPLLVERYELIPDSGGRGKWRGGLGLRRDVRVLHGPVAFSSHGDRHRHPARGLEGGEPGRPGRYAVNPGQPGERVLPAKTSGVLLQAGDLLRVETPGGGGYGAPAGRDAAALAADLRDGKVTRVPESSDPHARKRPGGAPHGPAGRLA